MVADDQNFGVVASLPVNMRAICPRDNFCLLAGDIREQISQIFRGVLQMRDVKRWRFKIDKFAELFHHLWHASLHQFAKFGR